MQLIILIIVFLLFGCSNPKISAELTWIDGRIDSLPKDAYILLKDIKSDDIKGRADKAFYALLYTQAQYKNYDVITSDSLIDVAVDYYSSKPFGDKQTRAYMYKAAALSDMERPREAIEWLKKAEQVADTTDYLTLGLINSHMGELYQKNFLINREDVEKYKKALKYYRLANNKKFENYTLNSIGMLYRKSNLDSGIFYLKASKNLSHELNDTIVMVKNLEMMSYSYILKEEYLMGMNMALEAFKLSNTHSTRLLCRLSTVYAKLNRLDSTDYYFTLITDIKSTGDSVEYITSKEAIAIAKGDFKMAYRERVIADEISNRVTNNARRNDLYTAEKQFDKTIIQEKANQLESQNTMHQYLFVIVILISIIVISVIYFVLKYRIRRANERIEVVEQIKSDIEHQNLILKNIEIKYNTRHKSEQELNTIIKSRIYFVKELATLKYEYGSNPDLFLKKFDEIAFNNRKNAYNAGQIITIANKLFNNIIAKSSEKYPKLTERDLLIIALTCFEFGPTEIGVYINAKSNNAIYIARCKIAKSLNVSAIEEYTRGFE